jgi:hypothetical protein
VLERQLVLEWDLRRQQVAHGDESGISHFRVEMGPAESTSIVSFGRNLQTENQPPGGIRSHYPLSLQTDAIPLDHDARATDKKS